MRECFTARRDLAAAKGARLHRFESSSEVLAVNATREAGYSGNVNDVFRLTLLLTTSIFSTASRPEDQTTQIACRCVGTALKSMESASLEAFSDRLITAIDRKGCPITVGLDPRLDLMPPGFLQDYFTRCGHTHQAASLAIRDFNLRILDVIAAHVPVVKVQVAFYEVFGPAGMQAFADTLSSARERELIVIADVKRGDIEMTAQAYAAAYLASNLPGVELSPGFEADAITVNPYVGGDGVVPFVEAAKSAGKGLFVLVKTSNPTSGDVQDLRVDGCPLYEHVARLVGQWGEGTEGQRGYQAVGAVVGATYPAEAARLRGLMPQAYFLVPGYGAQGGRVTDVQACFHADGYGAIINSSRGIIYAYRQEAFRAYGEENFPVAAEAAVLAMKQELAVLPRP